MFPLLPKGDQIKLLKFFWLKISLTPVANNWNNIRLQNLKVNLKAKVYIYMFPLLPKGDQIKLLKFFWLKIFSICHRCRWYRWQTLSCECLREFSKKFETVLMEYSGAGGKPIHENNQKQKISWHCHFDTKNHKKYITFIQQFLLNLKTDVRKKIPKHLKGQTSWNPNLVMQTEHQYSIGK